MSDITVFLARSVRTMEPSLPTAQAIAVQVTVWYGVGRTAVRKVLGSIEVSIGG